MAFKPVTNNALDIKKSSESHAGYYIGSEQIVTKIGPQIVWKFRDEDGLPFGVYGFTNLNRNMNGIALGFLVRLTYKGTINMKTKFGMKDVHQVLVEVDDEKKLDVKESHNEGPEGAEADPF